MVTAGCAVALAIECRPSASATTPSAVSRGVTAITWAAPASLTVTR